MLYYSSLALILVVLVAYHLRVTWAHVAFLLVLSTSLIHHSKCADEFCGKTLIAYSDRIIGHVTFVVMMYIVLRNKRWNVFILMYWLCAVAVVAIYYGYGTSRKNTDEANAIHAIMHVLVVIGSVSMLCGTYYGR